MSIKQKVTSQLNVQAAESFVEAIQDGHYYVFASRHTPFTADIDSGTDTTPPTPADTTGNLLTTYDQMLFGKRIRPEQTTTMIKRYNWTRGTVYAMYDDSDTEMLSKQFYVVADEGTNLNVYKCLNNNNNAKSTQKPFGKDLNPFELPQDGYVWKYMYTVDNFNARKFATSEFVPVISNTSVTEAAVPGSIEVVAVNDGGAGYRNFTVGSFPNEGAINIGGLGIKYSLASNASNISSYYNNCLIKITSGPAIGEFRLITNYTVENNRREITIDRQFVTQPRPLDSYEIYPNVFINDVSGTSTLPCAARAIINPLQGNTVSKIEVLSKGRNYRLVTADIRPANVVAITASAVIKPIISPAGGHGSNDNNELFAKFIGITAAFTGNSIPLTSTNDFRTVGVLKSPLFANVSVLVDSGSVVGSFIAGEPVIRYRPVRISSNVQLFANSLVVGGNTANFIDSLRTDDQVIITNGVTNVYANVLFVNSNTRLVIDKIDNALADSGAGASRTNCSLFYIQGDTFGTVTDYSVGKLTLTDTNPTGLGVSSFIVGANSFSTARVSNTQPNVFIGDRQADEFNAFNQLTTLKGTMTSTTPFVQDEPVRLGNSNNVLSAMIHSFQDQPGIANDFLYVSTVSNAVQKEGIIVGVTSNATFTVSDKYSGDIVRDSGEILYLENTNPIARNPTQTENIRIILEF